MISQVQRAAANWRAPVRRSSASSYLCMAATVMALLFCAGSAARAAGENYISYFGADWGPDGDTIYFIKQIISTKQGDTQWQGCHFWFCKMKWDGSEKKEISELWPGQNASVDLQGGPMWLEVNAATSNATFGILNGNGVAFGTWVVGLDGKSLHRLFNPIWNENERWVPVHPSWSPDGTKIVLEEDDYLAPISRISRLVVYDLVKKERRLLGDGQCNRHPVWSPKGDWIAYTHYLRYDSSYAIRRIWLIKPDGSEAKPMLDDKGKDINGHWPSWNPEGTKVSLTSDGVLWLTSLSQSKAEWIDSWPILGELSPDTFLGHHWGKHGWLASVGPIRLINPDKKSARMLAKAGVYKISKSNSEEARWGSAPQDIPTRATMGSK
jgi:Tol biopolymer transport system component